MQTTGHHACKKDGGATAVCNNGPFLSEYKRKENKLPFLGAGYYFWDDNIEMAKYWGYSHYDNSYYVIESRLNMPHDLLLDLVGNRQHMKYLVEIITRLKKEGHYRQHWQLSQGFEYLKWLNSRKPGIFPFTIIRGIDNNARPQKQFTYYYVKNKQSFIDLNPRLVICLIEKNPVVLQSRHIVFES